MLYKYHFIRNHKMHKLNQHFLFFIRSIRTAKTTSKFIPRKYLHSTFINVQGKIAPNGRKNENLETKFKLFFDSFKLLTQDNKDNFYKIILFSKAIHTYFEDITVDVHPLNTQNIKNIIGNDSFEELMNALWNSLKTNSWEIDKHYLEFFNNLPSKTCPFCGINQLSNPELYRPDYDHLTFKRDYPISAINLKNIAPSCSDCNQKFKHKIDVFYKGDRQTRRPFNYPYSSSTEVAIEFNGTIIPNTDLVNINGNWIINFTPHNDIIETWNDVYNIKQRYIHEVLEIDYNTWIGEFKKELKDHQVKIQDRTHLKTYFLKHWERYNQDRLQKRYIIKSSLFNYFYNCNNNIFYDQLISELK